MKQKLRILRLLLLAFAVGLFSYAKTIVKGGIRYELDETARTASVTGLSGFSGGSKLEIGEKVIDDDNGASYTITAIGSGAFQNNSSLTSVSIPATVTSIGGSAFYGSYITNVQFAEGSKLTEIGEQAFYGSRLESIELPSSLTVIGTSSFGNTALKSISIPQNVNSIYSSAFAGCTQLSEISFADNGKLETIGSSAFSGCTALQTISLPSSLLTLGDEAFTSCTALYKVNYSGTPKLTSVGSLAFKNCTELRSFTFPASVREIGFAPFSLCTSLEKIFLLPNTKPSGMVWIGNKQLVSKDEKELHSGDYSFRIYKDKYFYFSQYDYAVSMAFAYVGNDSYSSLDYISKLITYKNLSSTFTVDGVKYVPVSISDRTCDVIDCDYGNLSAETAIPSVVTYRGRSLTVNDIAPYSLYKTFGLKKLSVKNNGYVGDYAFYGAKDLESTEVLNGGLIGQYAFSNCPTLQNAIVKNEGKVSHHAFYANDSLISATIENKGDILEYAFANNKSLQEVTVNNNGSLGDYAFYNNASMKKAIVKNNGSVGQYAFSNNPSMEIVEVSNKGEIGYSAFSDNANLSRANISNEGNIGIYAFSRNSSLQQVEISNKGEIGSNAFANSGTSNGMSANIGSEVSNIASFAFYNSGLNGIVIPDNVTSVDTAAFMNCSKFASVKIGKGLTEISGSLFRNCSSLSEISIPENIEVIRNDVFNGCKSLARIFFENSNNPLKLGEANIYYDDIIDIFFGLPYMDKEGNYIRGNCYRRKVSFSPLFKDCLMDTVYVGRALEYLGHQLRGDFSLIYVGEYNLSPLNIDLINTKSPFQGTNIKAIGFSSKVKLISPYMFEGCSRLERIYLPDSIGYVGDYAFSGCTALKSARLSNELSEVNEGTFNSCTSLESIYIPKKVKTIGNTVFSNCNSLKLFVAEDSKEALSLGYNFYSGSSSTDGQGLFYTAGLDSIYVGRPITYPTASQYGYSPFYRHESLRAVELGDYEKIVQGNEFYGCRALESVTIGDGIESIGIRAFSDCPQLKYFAFGVMVKSVGREAFSDCTAMTTLIAQTPVPPTCGLQALDDINKWDCTLYVPAGVESKYMEAPYWKEFFFTAPAPDATYKIDLTPAPDGKSYATAYLPFSVQGQTDGTAKFYFASLPADGRVKLQAVKDAWMPAHSGYVVIDESGAKKATVTIRYSNPKTVQENALQGCLNDSTIEDAASKVYVLGNSKGVEGFFRPNSNVMKANRAFLPSTAEFKTLSFSFDNNTTTGIEGVTTEPTDDNAPVYDLSGRRVYCKLPKGIYIKQGRKFYVK